MTALTCRDCRALLPAYIDRELSARQRSQVAAHLDSCPRCDAAYVRQRNLAAGLRADLPGMGRLEPARAGALWRAVAGELASPRRVALPFSQRRLSLLLLVVAAALVLPWLLSPERLAALSLPLPPTPASVDAQATDAPAALGTRVAQVTLLLTPPPAPEYAPTQAALTTLLPMPLALDLPMTHAGATGAP